MDRRCLPGKKKKQSGLGWRGEIPYKGGPLDSLSWEGHSVIWSFFQRIQCSWLYWWLLGQWEQLFHKGTFVLKHCEENNTSDKSNWHQWKIIDFFFFGQIWDTHGYFNYWWMDCLLFPSRETTSFASLSFLHSPTPFLGGLMHPILCVIGRQT